MALVGAALAPVHARATSYLNFAERAADPASFYGEETYARLRASRPRSTRSSCSAATTRSPRTAERRYVSASSPWRLRPPGGGAGRRGSAPSEPRPVSERTSSSS